MFYHYKENIKPSYVSESNLKNFLTTNAKNNINNVKNQADAIKVFKNFGTHIIIGAYQGGRVDYSASTTSSSVSSAKDFSMAVKAKYEGAFTAGASSSYSTNTAAKKAAENAETTLHVYGGATNYAFEITNKSEYLEWSKGLEDEGTWTLCDFPRDDEGQALYPIWLLCDKQETKNIFVKAFKAWSLDEQNRFVLKAPEQKPLYIVGLRHVSTPQKSEMPAEVLTNLGDGYTWYRLGSDWNWGTKKQKRKSNIYYRFGTKEEGAISSIVVYGAEKSGNAKVPSDYIDLGDINNAGVGGYYVRVGYKSDLNAKKFVTGLRQTISTGSQDYKSKGAENAKNWEVLNNQKDLASRMEFNKGNGKGSADIYMYITYESLDIPRN